VAYLVCDALCKNVYGIINANTLFRVLDGKWEPETEEEVAEGGRQMQHHRHQSYMDQFLAGIRTSKSKPRDTEIEHGDKSVARIGHAEYDGYVRYLERISTT